MDDMTLFDNMTTAQVAQMEVGAVAFVLFAIGILCGLFVFHILSRRWFT